MMLLKLKFRQNIFAVYPAKCQIVIGKVLFNIKTTELARNNKVNADGIPTHAHNELRTDIALQSRQSLFGIKCKTLGY